MADKAALGAQGVPFRMDLERGKILEFARATHTSNEAYAGDHPAIPPTFLTSMFFWEETAPGADPWDRVKMDQRRGMHAEQEYVFHGPPPRAGTKLTAVSRIDQFYEKAGKRGGNLTFVVKLTEFRDESGKLVAEARMTGVETSKPPEEKS
jgi:hypothetical protein